MCFYLLRVKKLAVPRLHYCIAGVSDTGDGRSKENIGLKMTFSIGREKVVHFTSLQYKTSVIRRDDHVLRKITRL